MGTQRGRTGELRPSTEKGAETRRAKFGKRALEEKEQAGDGVGGEEGMKRKRKREEGESTEPGRREMRDVWIKAFLLPRWLRD